MKSTGNVCKGDELGRIVIPMELRRTLEINEKDPLEIFIDVEEIILRKFFSNAACIVTGEITPCNFTLFDNITLSPNGAELFETKIIQCFTMFLSVKLEMFRQFPTV
jgi:AbrB family transcriptional regulator, transcriptional pleiotropic regulator of transition state genes